MDENQDSARLQGIFPLEVWRNIGEVADPDTFFNLFHSSPIFRHLFLPHRTTYLFPNVWRILGKKYQQNFENDLPDSEYYEGGNESGDDDWPPERNEAIPWFSGILKMRLVCKRWCQAIDNCHQNIDHHFLPPEVDLKLINETWFEYSELVIEPKKSFMVRFGPEKPAQKFLQHFEATHDIQANNRSPFVGGAIFVESEQGTEILNGVQILLAKYGHHVRFFTFFLERFSNSEIVIYQKLREFLELMPNLEALLIAGDACEQTERSEEYLRLFGNTVAELPLPKLDSIKIFSMRKMSALIYKEVLKSCKNVQRLDIEDQFAEEYFTKVCEIELQNLQQFSMPLYSGSVIDRLLDEKLKWRLTKLCLGKSISTKCEFVPWEKVFNLLESKFSTLTELVLTLPEAKSEADKEKVVEDSLMLRLNLPKLKVLKLYLKDFAALDFLLPLKNSLVYLDVWASYRKDITREDVEKRQVIKCVGYFEHERVLESNVWELFPKLERVETLCSENTRGEYENFLKTKSNQ